MLQATPSVFVGKDRTRIFRDYLHVGNFYLMFEGSEGLTKSEGHEIMKLIKEEKENSPALLNLQDVEAWLQQVILKAGISTAYSLSAAVVHKNIVYVKTVGEGEVHLRRGKDFVRLIHGQKTASGYVKEKDLLVLTSSSFRELIEEEEKLKNTMDSGTAKHVTQKLEDFYDQKQDNGTLAMFLQFEEGGEDLPVDDDMPTRSGTPSVATIPDEPEERLGLDDSDSKRQPNYHSHAVESTEIEDDDVMPPARKLTAAPPGAIGTTGTVGAAAGPAASMAAAAEKGLEASAAGVSNRPVVPLSARQRFLDENADTPSTAPSMASVGEKKSPLSGLAAKLPSGRLSPKTSKIVTGAILLVILVILVWSVVFGYQRRQAAEAKKKIDAVAVSVEKKTTEAEEIAFLNIDRALALLQESKNEVQQLREDVGAKFENDIKPIEAKIQEKENTIVQKEESEPEEFYDLALEDKDASGTQMFLEGDKIVILDKSAKTAYNFDADKKSIEKSENDVLGSATLVGMVKGVIYAFVPGKGLYSFTDDTSVKEAIKNDSDWGEIKDIAFFAGNVYMLDPEAGDIHKYVPIANGFGEKSSYFTGDAPDLATANSLKIDASVYVGLKNKALKFTRGEADDFQTSFPTTKVELYDIYTDENTEQVFAWDKKNATMYVLGKNGGYERQIKAGILAKAADFVVYKNQILVLSGSKIYILPEEAAP